MEAGSITDVLKEKKTEGWKGWKVPIPVLLDVIRDHVMVGKNNVMEADYIVFAAKDERGNIISIEESKLFILGHTMDKGKRDRYLGKYYGNPTRIPNIPPDNPGEIDMFPPW